MTCLKCGADADRMVVDEHGEKHFLCEAHFLQVLMPSGIILQSFRELLDAT